MSTSSSSTQAQAQLAQAVNALTQITTQLAKTVMQQQQQQQLIDSCFGGPVTGAAAAAVDATNGWVVVPQQYQQQQQHQQVGATTGSCFPGMFPGSKIAGCSSGDGNAARAVVTVHGGIWGQFRAGGFGNWSEWMVLSDPDTTSWSAVSVALTSVNTTNQTSGLAILALDNHGVIHMKYRWGPQGTLWTSWTTVDTTAIASPVKRICASIWGPNIIVLAATSTSIWMLQYNFASASGTQGPTISTSWTDLGSGGNSTYTAGVLDLACAQLPNSLGGHLFAVCSDGVVRSRVASTISTTNFDNWGQTQASAAATQISIAPYSDQRLQIIAVMQSDGSLQYNRKTSTDRNASWSGWNAFPVALNGVLTAAIYPVGAGQQIDVISSKGTIFSTSNTADQTTGWSPWTPLNDTTRPAWTISQINTDISGAAVTIAGGAVYDGQTNTPLNAVMSGSYVVCCHSIGAVLIEEYGCNDIGQSFLRINGQYMLPMNLTSTTSLTLSLNSGNSTVTINGTTIPIICCIRDTRSFNVALANITNLGTASLRQTWNQDAMTAARSIGFPDICLTNRTIPVCCDQYKIMMRSLQFPTSALFESVSQLSGWWSDFKTWIAKNWIVVLVGAILVILLGLFFAATAGGGGIITGAFIATAGDDAIAATVPVLASYASDVAGTTVTNAQVLDAFAQGVNAANGQAAQSAANIVNLLLNL